ncbi:MAG: class I SAM-dependent methyltransferase [Candidatus Bathyarchaeota archaeon]|nr:class I SAM-dependent methyltransferase [Candidatus Bathyarchaeota archaeon]
MNAIIPENNQVKEYFNETIQFYDRSNLDTDTKQREFFFFEEEFIPKYFDSIDCCIDIGCGAGMFLEYITRYYEVSHVVGLDISNGMLAEVKPKKPASVELTQGSILEFPYKKNQYDMVYMDDVLHHIVSKRRSESKKLVMRALENIKHITKPNGIFILREQFYESYFIPTISSKIIMFLLNLFNALGLKLPHREAHIGLLVTFYTRSEIRELIETLGGRILEKRDRIWRKSIGDILILVKNMGKSYLVIDFPDD